MLFLLEYFHPVLVVKSHLFSEMLCKFMDIQAVKVFCNMFSEIPNILDSPLCIYLYNGDRIVSKDVCP